MGCKSRDNWRVTECVKFDCENRRASKCRDCIKFSNFKEREEPDRSKHPHY